MGNGVSFNSLWVIIVLELVVGVLFVLGAMKYGFISVQSKMVGSVCKYSKICKFDVLITFRGQEGGTFISRIFLP